MLGVGSVAILGERGREETYEYEVLELAVLVQTSPPNIEIVALLLEHVEDLPLRMGYEPGIGSLPVCLGAAVDGEYLDILDLLLTKANLVSIDTFSPFYCLALAILENKSGVFTHLLQQPGAIASVDQRLPLNGRYMTLLEFAREHNRTQMYEQLEMLTKEEVSDESGNNDNKIEVDCEVEENEPDEFIVSYSNLKNKNSTVANDSVKNDKKTVSNVTCSSDEKKVSNDKKDDLTEVTDSEIANGKACWQCGIFGRYKCVGCRKARYCSEECQLDNWPGHRGYCLVKMNKIAFKEFKSMSASIFG